MSQLRPSSAGTVRDGDTHPVLDREVVEEGRVAAHDGAGTVERAVHPGRAPLVDAMHVHGDAILARQLVAHRKLHAVALLRTDGGAGELTIHCEKRRGA